MTKHHGDIRGMGRAYVLTPPSTTPAGAYVFHRPLVHVQHLPVASPGLLEYLNPPRRPVPRRSSLTPPADPGAARAAAVSMMHYLADQLGRMRPDTGRNHALSRAAYQCGGYLGSGLLTREEIVDALLKAAERCGHLDDYGERQTLSTLQRGITAGSAAPITPNGAKP